MFLETYSLIKRIEDKTNNTGMVSISLSDKGLKIKIDFRNNLVLTVYNIEVNEMVNLSEDDISILIDTIVARFNWFASIYR